MTNSFEGIDIFFHLQTLDEKIQSCKCLINQLSGNNQTLLRKLTQVMVNQKF
jgi:hypothetical protein